jgi:HEAT repeat protein
MRPARSCDRPGRRRDARGGGACEGTVTVRALLTLLAATTLAIASASSARTDGHEDGAATDDLISTFRPFYDGRQRAVPWSDWWYANRREVLKPTCRAASQSAVIDQKARDRARDALLVALASKDTNVASEAAMALGRLGDPRDIATLAKIVSDGQEMQTRRLHRYAAIGMGMLPLGDAAQAAEAKAALLGVIAAARGRQGEQSFFVTYCAFALAMRGDASALPDLAVLRRKALAAVDMRTSLYTEILGGICYALGGLGGEGCLPEIEEHLGGKRAPDAGNNDTSWFATQTLARVGGAEARRLLLEATRDDRKTVRAGALQALGACADAKDDETAQILRAAMVDDKQSDCRRMAAVSLGRIGHASAQKALLAALDEGQFDDRSFAATGLGFLLWKHPDPTVSGRLVDALAKSGSDAEQGSLALACGLAAAQSARPRLAEIVASGAPSAASIAAFSLGLIGAGPVERKVLHQAVAQSGDPLRRREAALALGMLRDGTVVEHLRAIAGGRTAARDRGTAVICLGRVGSDADIDFLVDLMADRDTGDQLRACVVQALGWLLDRTDLGRLSRIAADIKWDKYVNGNSLSWSGEAMWDVQHLVD